mgnify:CR=1 FL=1
MKTGKKSKLLTKNKVIAGLSVSPCIKETVYGEINLRRTTTATLKAVLENPQRIIEKDLKKK